MTSKRLDRQPTAQTNDQARPFTAFREAAERAKAARDQRKTLFGAHDDPNDDPYDIGREPPGGFSPVDRPYVARVRALQRSRLKDTTNDRSFDR